MVCGRRPASQNETLLTEGPTSRHLEQVVAELKMRPVFSPVGQPSGRRKVERFLGVLNQLFLSALAGYSAAGALRAAPVLTGTGRPRRSAPAPALVFVPPANGSPAGPAPWRRRLGAMA